MRSLKRIISILLSAILLLSCATVALAEEVPTAPYATVTELENEDFTFAVEFLNPQPTFDQQTYYNGWLAEYELSFSKPITLGTDVEISIRNPQMSINDWMSTPMAQPLAANQVFGVMDFVFNMEATEHHTPHYGNLFLGFAELDLGFKFSDAYLEANPNVMTSINLKLTNPETNEVVVLGQHTNGVPEMPGATVTPITQDGMTFAMNFLMKKPTDEQMLYYADWYADFELTINKDVTFDANGTGDGWLAGQYDAWSPNWINVPISPVTIKAGETIKIMEFAAKLLSQSGLKLTYADVYRDVKDFDCGVFFDEEFLLANPDVEVKLELKMYNPADETENYVIGDTLIFTYDPEAPQLPTATVAETENEDLTFSMNFKVDDTTLAQQAYYGKWYADFELTINKTVTLNNDGSADGWLSGQYDAWSENWVTVPFGKFAPVTLQAGETIKVMEFAAELMDEPGLKYTFIEVYQNVKDFDCGIFFSPEFLVANPDLEVKLELRMYNPADENESYTIGDTYIFRNEFVAYNNVTNKFYTDLNKAALECGENETVLLLKDVSVAAVTVLENTTLDLNGKSLTATYMSCFGNLIDSSADNSGLLVVPASHFMIREDNKQLPVRDGNGYRFVEVQRIDTRYLEADSKFAFQTRIEPSMLALLKQGQDATGVTIQVMVRWKQGNGYRTQNFVYTDSYVQQYLNSYNAGTDKYSQMFTLTLNGAESFEELTFTAQIVSEHRVTFSATH